MVSGDGLLGQTYSPDYTCKVAEGEITLTYKTRHCFDKNMEDEDILQYIEDNVFEYLDEIKEVVEVDITTHIEG